MIDRMLNMAGRGNAPFAGYNGTPQAYGQGPYTTNTTYLSTCRNDCSLRVGYATFSPEGLYSGNTANYFGPAVAQNQAHLQVVAWPSSHLGLTQNNLVYEMTAGGGYLHGTRTVQQVTRITGINPIFHNILR